MNQPQTQVVIVKEQGNALGLAGLIFSVLGWLTCGILCPLGALLSFFGLFSRGPKSTAIAGLVVGFPGVIFFVLFGLGFILTFLGIGGAAIKQASDAAAQARQQTEIAAQDIGESGSQSTDVAPMSQTTETSPPVTQTVTSQPSFLPIGSMVNVGENRIKLSSARLGKAELRDKVRKTPTKSEDPCLTLYFVIQNNSDRKVLTFRPDPSFGPRLASVRDDVDNVVRHVDFGFLLEVVGGEEDLYDVAPQTSMTYAMVFTDPLPQTKHLIVTIDLEVLGGRGEVKIKVPREKYDSNYKTPDMIAEEASKTKKLAEAEKERKRKEEEERLLKEQQETEKRLEMEAAAKAAEARAERVRVAAEKTDFRDWTSKDGKFKVFADLIKVNETTVVLLRLDKAVEVEVPLEKLSDEDNEYVKNLGNK